MSPLIRFTALPAAALALGLWQFAGAQSTPEEPTRVLTDTPEYCAQLAGEAAQETQAKPPAPDLVVLITEGQRMCQQGQIRGGILRLRRALMLMKQTAGTQ
jgi:hypothetical protein